MHSNHRYHAGMMNASRSRFFLIFITSPGATGFVGSRLVAKLSAQGHKVRALTRNEAQAKAKLPYPNVVCVGQADWARAIDGTTAVINLAGEPIATRWT